MKEENKEKYLAFFRGELDGKTSIELAEYLNVPHKKIFSKIKKNGSKWVDKYGLEELELISVTGDDFYLLSPVQAIMIAGELDARTYVDTMMYFPTGFMELFKVMGYIFTPDNKKE